MADQKSQGGQKQGHGGQGDSQQQQHVHGQDEHRDTETHAARPAEGQPGGPKQGHGQTRSQD